MNLSGALCDRGTAAAQPPKQCQPPTCVSSVDLILLI